LTPARLSASFWPLTTRVAIALKALWWISRAAAGAGIVALGLSGGKKAEAAPGDPFILGQPNDTGGTQTDLEGSVAPGAVLRVATNSTEPTAEALVAFNYAHVALSAHSQLSAGVNASSQMGSAIYATSHSESESGVEGHNTAGGRGVYGHSQNGPGVKGVSGGNPGVEGVAPGDFPGVRAVSRNLAEPNDPDGGLALDVVGKARFSTAGAGAVPARAVAVTVSNPAVTDKSHITVTLTGNPGRASVAWVERQPGSGFIVHLTAALLLRALPFTYLVVEPGESTP